MIIEEFLDICMDIFYTVYDMSQPVLDFIVSETLRFGGHTYTLLDFAFGGAIVVFLGATLVKWIVGIVT